MYHPAAAQDYRFQVPDEAAVVTINTDGSISIDYTITFTNDSGAHPIDIVDIGMPNSDYVLNSISAQVDGKKITKITQSDVVNPGISVYLLTNEIPAGGSGTVTVHVGTVKNVIYPATQTESEPYGSLEFSPNWFDSQYCYGNTNLQVTFCFPGRAENHRNTLLHRSKAVGPVRSVPESMLRQRLAIFFTPGFRTRPMPIPNILLAPASRRGFWLPMPLLPLPTRHLPVLLARSSSI